MKILAVVQRFYPAIGGAEHVLKQYLDYLSINHEIVVYTSDALDLSSLKYQLISELNSKDKVKLLGFAVMTVTLSRFFS